MYVALLVADGRVCQASYITARRRSIRRSVGNFKCISYGNKSLIDTALLQHDRAAWVRFSVSVVVAIWPPEF